MIITIDGPIATGKSTIAKAVAKEVGYIYFDTGAMYRCLTYGIIKNKIAYEDSDQLKRFLAQFQFEIKLKLGEKHYFVENEDVTEKIRLEKVTGMVSKISAIKEVREKLVAIQREFALGVNAVFEGRDMGTVVFPEAQIKIYLTGKPEVRATRRYEELKKKYNLEVTFEQVLKEITERDQYDMTREISPLCQPKEAYVIDTSDLSIPDIVLKILEYKDTIKTHK